MDKPEKCCTPGEYTCQIPMAINGKVQFVDFCIAHIISALNAANITTVASCCGHGTQDGSIALDNGREIVIRTFREENHVKKDNFERCGKGKTMPDRLSDKELFYKFREKCPWHNRMTTNLCEAKTHNSDCQKNNCAPFFWVTNMTVLCVGTKE